MSPRLIAGSCLSWLYNGFWTYLPSHVGRRLFLSSYLGSLGRGTTIQMRCRILNGRKVFLGRRNVINFGCLFDGRRFSIRTGDDVSIGPEAAILTLGHDPQSADFADRGQDVVIGDRAWIGFRVIILPGVTVGEGAVVGAGSVVAKDVEPFSIVAGSPARKIGERNRELDYHLDFKPLLL
jgi:acetyltransferase-like isoleucine patch superfamily enzyme